jgi:hypothetical protein
MAKYAHEAYARGMEPELSVVAGASQDDGHRIEPVKDSWYTKGGRVADLFNLQHYPIEAVCWRCHSPIIAETFLGAWAHFVRM